MSKMKNEAIRQMNNATLTKTQKENFLKSFYLKVALKMIADGRPNGVFKGKENDCNFSASANLYVISAAWHAGLDLENEADGFALGAGTMGDWSAIRDSSNVQKKVMLKKAMSFLAKKGIK